jgi:tetratricopeptide (TPR) repeat protein
MNPRILLVALCASLLASFPAWAANGGPSTPAAPDPLATARDAVKQKNWPAAIAELKQINAADNADWNNLMGYSVRKSTPPDYEAAERYYNEALRIDPKHKDALEYSGELYLILGKLPEAEQRLATLDKVCFFPCEQFTDLKKAVARYKAAGNKYVAE